MRHSRVQLAILAITFVLISGQVYACTPDRALENPLFLSEIEESPLVYVGYTTGAEQFLVSYVEYDEFANGYGAFTFLTSGKGEAGSVSFVAVKEYQNGSIGMGIHRGDGVTSVDAGLSYSFGKVEIRAGIHDVPLTRWNENKDQINVSVGGSVDITETIRVGVDARTRDTWGFTLHSQIELTPNLITGVNVGFAETKWKDAGIELWVSRNKVLVHLGYTLKSDLTSAFRLGLGFRF